MFADLCCLESFISSALLDSIVLLLQIVLLPLNTHGCSVKPNKVESALASEEAEMERQELRMKAAPEAAPSAAADEVSTPNLAQMKRSTRDLFEDEE